MAQFLARKAVAREDVAERTSCYDLQMDTAMVDTHLRQWHTWWIRKYLDGGYGNTIGINGNDGTQQNSAQQRRHEDAPDGRGRRKENRQRDVTLSDVGAQGRRLQKEAV